MCCAIVFSGLVVKCRLSEAEKNSEEKPNPPLLLSIYAVHSHTPSLTNYDTTNDARPRPTEQMREMAFSCEHKESFVDFLSQVVTLMVDWLLRRRNFYNSGCGCGEVESVSIFGYSQKRQQVSSSSLELEPIGH